MSIDQWEKPATELVLLSGNVHIWRATLDQPAACVQRLAQTLSADERRRAERFCFERDRRRFIVGRGLLRTILGRYLHLEPGQLCFCYSAYGKPSLDPKSLHNLSDLAVRFNLAHSHGLALYAVTCKQEIGVDIEYIRPIAETEQIVQRFFSAWEVGVWRALSPSQQQEAFFNCWTRKEAYIKAIGDGLACRLDLFDVSFAPGEPAQLLSDARDFQAASRWFIQALTPATGYVAAVVVATEGHDCLQPSDWQFEHWDFVPSRELCDSSSSMN